MTSEAIRTELFDRRMREIRRANHGIQACAEVLARHDENDGSLPGARQVFIRFEASEVGGLHCAMLELSRLIEERLDELDNDHSFGYHDEYYPTIRKECDIDNAREQGQISWAEAVRAHEENSKFGNLSSFEPLEDIKNSAD